MKQFRNPYKYQGGWAWLAAAAPIVGAAIDWLSGERAANKQRKHTRSVATNEAYGSVAGRVEAAKAAGLHPAAALGVPSSSGSSMGGGMTDFRSAATDAVTSYSQQRQWKQEQEFQKAQAQDIRNMQKNQEMRDNAKLNADLAMTNKQMQFIDEQILASREQRIREATRSQVAGTPNLGESVIDNMKKIVPNEVTAHSGGVAAGVQPGYQYVEDPVTGRVHAVPFGSQPEGSEIFNTLRDFAAHYEIPLDSLTGKRLWNRLKGEATEIKRQRSLKTRNYAHPRNIEPGG